MTKAFDPALLDLAQEFRETLRLGVYMFRRLDPEGDLTAAQLSLLAMISDGGLRVGDVARNLGIKVPSATEQIIKLERAGLVSMGRAATKRPRRLEAAPLAEADAWIERYRGLWETSFRRLDALLAEIQTPSPDASKQ